MRFAICNETFQDWPLERALRFARQCGYSGIEFAPFTLGADAMEISPQTRADIRRALDECELETVGLHWLLAKTTGYYLTSPDVNVRRRTSEYFVKLSELCRDLRGHVLVLGSPQQRNLLPGVTHEQAVDYAADVLHGALSAFIDCDVTLAIEPLGPAEGDFLLTAEDAIQLVSRFDSPCVRLHLDVKAMSSEVKPIRQIILDSADYLVHFHANDPNRRGPGMGDVDFLPIFAALKQINYQGWVSVEVFDYEPGPERLARESIRYMMQCADRVKD
jgi:sugar phosphate isomerase/epimerase